MTNKMIQTRENIYNSNLVYKKNFNLPYKQNIKILNHPEKLEIVLLNQLQTKNNQNYQYWLILLESGNPKYTVYAEENETKQSIIYGYNETGYQPINTQTKENISE